MAAAPLLLQGLSEADRVRLAQRLDQVEDDVERLAEAWRLGARVAVNNARGLRICRLCGCHEHHACGPAPCFWVEADLCSACDGAS